MRRGKGSKAMAIVDGHGFPVTVDVASVSLYEPHLVPATLDARFLADLPTRPIGDRGYDSDALDGTPVSLWLCSVTARKSKPASRACA